MTSIDLPALLERRKASLREFTEWKAELVGRGWTDDDLCVIDAVLKNIRSEVKDIQKRIERGEC